MKSFLLSLALLAALIPVNACKRVLQPPDLGVLYDRVAQYHDTSRNPVVVIPGILGSKLEQVETGRTVWGAFDGDYADPEKSKGARLIALPMELGKSLEELRDDVQQAGALESLRLRVFGLPIGISAYVNILLALGVGGYLDRDLTYPRGVDYGEEHFTCFQFAYDWRRCISESAADLGAFLDEQEAYVLDERGKRGIVSPDGPIHFDVVAHSMGGLVLRYYLRYGTQPMPADGSLPRLTWAGAARIDRAVLIGTPNAGAAGAFFQLLDGFKPGLFLPRYDTAILGTFPAVYEMLPRGRHGFWTSDDQEENQQDEWLQDPLDPELWVAQEWGLADPRADRMLKRLLPNSKTSQERRAIALEHQRKCLARARSVQAALDLPAKPPPGCELMLVIGDAIETPSEVRVKQGVNGYEVSAMAGGDEVVLRSSVLADERLAIDQWTPRLRTPLGWTRTLFLFEDHLGLTKSPVFLDNLLFFLLEEPRASAPKK